MSRPRTAGPPPGDGAWMHDPERYLRWLQWGAQSPFFRPHASHGVVVPWAYNATAAWMEPLWRFRSAILPYTYAAAHAAAATGVLAVRGLYVDWPGEEGAYAAADFAGGAILQHTFGDAFIVAPVTQSVEEVGGLPVWQPLWVPPGAWIACQSRDQALLTGPGPAGVSLRSLGEQGTLCRAGAVVPGRLWNETSASIGGALVLTVFWPTGAGLPPGAASEAAVPEDDGETLGGPVRVTTAALSVGDGWAALAVRVTGSFPGAPALRAYSVRLRGFLAPAGADVRVTVNGSSWAGWAATNTTGGQLGEADIWAHAAGAGVAAQPGGAWSIPVLTVDLPAGDAAAPFNLHVAWGANATQT